MNTKENNKLIAEFMGMEEQDMSFRIPKEILKGIHENDCPNSNDVDCWDIPLKDLKYHTSWDWLMPVVEKIEDLEFKGRKIYFSLSTNSISVMLKPTPNDHIPKTIVKNKSGTKHEATYKAVVEFINQYNKNK
tara:strand:+ start:686 stop:1084 length:399 start_codon:yes stop_codon:yes gene_type:complete